MVELVYTYALGAYAARIRGSTPLDSTSRCVGIGRHAILRRSCPLGRPGSNPGCGMWLTLDTRSSRLCAGLSIFGSNASQKHPLEEVIVPCYASSLRSSGGMADTVGSNPAAERRKGSTPLTSTKRSARLLEQQASAGGTGVRSTKPDFEGSIPSRGATHSLQSYLEVR